MKKETISPLQNLKELKSKLDSGQMSVLTITDCTKINESIKMC